MSRRLVPFALALLALVPVACRTSVTEQRREEVRHGALMRGELLSYQLVYSSHDGKVGYLKTYAVTEAGGPVYKWKYVYDLEFNELGFVDQFGTAYRFHAYTEHEQTIYKVPQRTERMPVDSMERNVMRMLGIDPALDDVSFPRATRADIAFDG